MTPDPSPASPAPGPPGAAARFPAWSPAWAVQLGELCFSGTTSVFLLHGNTNDLVRRGESPDEGYGTIAEFLAERSEEHTSELQSPCNLVCRLLLEKKKKNKCGINIDTAYITTMDTWRISELESS